MAETISLEIVLTLVIAGIGFSGAGVGKVIQWMRKIDSIEHQVKHAKKNDSIDPVLRMLTKMRDEALVFYTERRTIDKIK